MADFDDDIRAAQQIAEEAARACAPHYEWTCVQTAYEAGLGRLPPERRERVEAALKRLIEMGEPPTTFKLN